mmetsp:Transcript_15673/g.14190  ORF Transcript_15673/g.14190 Transcript_15673/m.14190 type:complete len:156 (+) Transcript_15673:44-511(+)
MKLIISIIVITFLSIVSSFSFTRIIKNVNKAAAVAVVSSMITTSPALADIIFATQVKSLVLVDLGGVTANYPDGSYLTYDCPGNKAKSTVTISTVKSTKNLKDTVTCSTDLVEVIQNVGAGGDFTTDATPYGSKFTIAYNSNGKVVSVSAKKTNL